jgi:hypothetical protein
VPTKRSSTWGSSGRRGSPRLPLIVAALLLAGCGSHRTATAPPLPKGHPELVSFLDTQAQPSASGNASRSQLVFLKSMDTQSHAAGLRTIVVDAGHASASALVNVRYDWALPSTMRVMGDPGGKLAREYHVVHVPTTLLLNARGSVVRRWIGFARAADLDFAVRKITGRHVFGQS